MEYRITRRAKKAPDNRLVMRFEVVDVIDGTFHRSRNRLLFETREEAQDWMNRHRSDN